MTHAEIVRHVYGTMKQPLAIELNFLGRREIWAVSQYGYYIGGPFPTLQDAEAAAVAFYTSTPEHWRCLTQDTQWGRTPL